MLSNALSAMSLAKIGDENRYQDAFKASITHYTGALMGLRSGLRSGSKALDDYQADVSLVTCLSCGMYEVCKRVFHHQFNSQN